MFPILTSHWPGLFNRGNSTWLECLYESSYVSLVLRIDRGTIRAILPVSVVLTSPYVVKPLLLSRAIQAERRSTLNNVHCIITQSLIPFASYHMTRLIYQRDFLKTVAFFHDQSFSYLANNLYGKR